MTESTFTDSTPYKLFKVAQPFVLGGASGMLATSVIQPIDMLKVRVQLQNEGMRQSSSAVTIAMDLLHKEGFLAMYKGLSAALLRQATYTTTRMGVFRLLADAMKKDNEPLPLWKKAIVSLTAGGIGSVVGTPSDLALVRMQADGKLPLDARRNYTGVFNALLRISQEEGVLAWWKGCTPTVVRAMALNLGMLASYEQSKEFFQKHYGHSFLTAQLPASLVSGFFASILSLPFDLVKTRLQNQRPLPDGTLPYSGPWNCAHKILRHEGPLAFYTGFLTFFVRIAPHVMITLLALETMNGMIKRFEEKQKQKQTQE